jgi:integrase
LLGERSSGNFFFGELGAPIMASVIDDPNGRRRIQFVAPDESRKTIRLGKIDRKSAESICRQVEHLLAAKMNAQPIPRDTAAWLSEAGAALKDRLAAVGLIESAKRAALGDFLREYVLNRPDVKSSTLEIWQQPCRNLNEFFGDDKPLRSNTAGDAEQFKAWLLTQSLAPATVAKRLAFARTFLHVARKHKFIDENPFSEVKIPTANVSARQRFIDQESVQRMLDVANPIWRTIIALSRFGGLRCPSEVLSIEWRHIDWERNRITVPSPKTERYDGKASRSIPLFAELRPHLEEAFELAEPGQTFVVGGKTGDGFRAAARRKPGQWMNANLRTTLLKIIHRAGLKAWPRLFHNLRASRETELLEKHPVHVVAHWMGHDAKVCLKHYAQITDEHYEKATGGAKSGAVKAQNAAQQVLAGIRSESHQKQESPDFSGDSASYCDLMRDSEQLFSGAGGI